MSWSQKTEAFLTRDNLWDMVNAPPAQPDAEQLRKIGKACATIILSLEDSQLPYVRGIRTAKAVWDTLRAIYVWQTAGSRISLTKALYKAQ